MTEVIVLTGEDAGSLHNIECKLEHLYHIENKLDQLITMIAEGNNRIMSQLSDVIRLINDETNLISQTADDDAAATEENALAVAALRAQIQTLIDNDGTPTPAEIAALDEIASKLSTTKTSLMATAARLRVIASDPNNPVPTSTPVQ